MKKRMDQQQIYEIIKNNLPIGFTLVDNYYTLRSLPQGFFTIHDNKEKLR